MSGSLGGIAMPRMGTSLSMRCSLSERSKSSAAFFASGLISFIWPSSAPTTSTSDMPPIAPVMCFQVQPFSRLMSRIFSVSASRFMLFSCWKCEQRQSKEDAS